MAQSDKNSGFLQLGDNIFLQGFNEIDNASMIILKKIIGTHINRLNESKKFEKIEIGCDKKDNKYCVNINIHQSPEDKNDYSYEEDNIFICIDSCFKKIGND